MVVVVDAVLVPLPPPLSSARQLAVASTCSPATATDFYYFYYLLLFSSTDTLTLTLTLVTIGGQLEGTVACELSERLYGTAAWSKRPSP